MRTIGESTPCCAPRSQQHGIIVQRVVASLNPLRLKIRWGTHGTNALVVCCLRPVHNSHSLASRGVSIWGSLLITLPCPFPRSCLRQSTSHGGPLVFLLMHSFSVDFATCQQGMRVTMHAWCGFTPHIHRLSASQQRGRRPALHKPSMPLQPAFPSRCGMPTSLPTPTVHLTLLPFCSMLLRPRKPHVKIVPLRSSQHAQHVQHPSRVCRLTPWHHASRITHHASRITHHASCM